MHGIKQLKQCIRVTETTVECPVKGCIETVERQRGYFKRQDRFRCSKHLIYISPTTFEYQNKFGNLLWHDSEDLSLFKMILTVKRESRIAREKSEDAVTWNVFRFLERNHLVEAVLGKAIGIILNPTQVIYWSYNQKERSNYSDLNAAREEFGEQIKRGSEPDIIVVTDTELLFIEAKLTANNRTVPSDINNSKKYENGADYWYKRVFKTDYKSVAIIDKKYELLRFWLLGTWMAKQKGLNFYLINLTLSEREENIIDTMGKHLIQNQRMHFLRITWEDLYHQILNTSSGIETEIIAEYFMNKTLGYDRGELKKAFCI